MKCDLEEEEEGGDIIGVCVVLCVENTLNCFCVKGNIQKPMKTKQKNKTIFPAFVKKKERH